MQMDDILEKVPCPLCKNTQSFISIQAPSELPTAISQWRAVFGRDIGKSQWVICGVCGFVHQNPRPSEKAINLLYSSALYHHDRTHLSLDKQTFMDFARWYYGDKIRYAIQATGLSRGRMFEPGAGCGGVMKIFEECGWEVGGMEPDSHYANYAQAVIGLPSIECSLLTSKTVFAEKYDLIFTNHVLEHIGNFEEIMLGMKNALKPGGFVFTAVPTHFKNRSSYSRTGLSLSHTSSFTHQSLNQLFARYGFEEIEHTYRGWKKEIDDVWHVAQLTEAKLDYQQYYENPLKVARYWNIINPINSIFWYPVYSNWSYKVMVVNNLKRRIKLLFTSPVEFFTKFKNYFFQKIT